MKLFNTGLVLALSLFSANAVWADCREVSGKVHEVQIPAPNDQWGRILGTVEGTLNGSATAYITQFLGDFPTAVTGATTNEVFLTTQGDLLIGTGLAAFAPIAGQPPYVVSDKLVVTVGGGTGRYQNATGTITFQGVGSLLPGAATFDLTYKGTVCGPNLNGRN